jgi:hypothetical protein
MNDQPTTDELRSAFLATFRGELSAEELKTIREKRTTWQGRQELILRSLIDKLIESRD